MVTVKIFTEAFDPWQEVKSYQKALVGGGFGATSIFIGTMRDFNDGDDVKSMTLEHYPGMTEKQLESIVFSAGDQWPIIDALVVHRVGMILPSEPIVLIAVWSAHRGAACDASRYIIETLKTTAPFWKKEVLITEQSRWVSKNTDGYHAH